MINNSWVDIFNAAKCCSSMPALNVIRVMTEIKITDVPTIVQYGPPRPETIICTSSVLPGIKDLLGFYGIKVYDNVKDCDVGKTIEKVASNYRIHRGDEMKA